MTFDSAAWQSYMRSQANHQRSVLAAGRKVMRRSGVEMKKQLLRDMRSSRHFRGAAKSIIDFDEVFAGEMLTIKAGPQNGTGLASNLANVAYFGTSRGGGTVRDPAEVLQAEAVKTVEWLDKVVMGE